MDPVYLTHPLHGVHVAYHPQEVERCMSEGWAMREERAERTQAKREGDDAVMVPGRRTPLKLPRKGSLK